jgi:hypothetical protein
MDGTNGNNGAAGNQDSDVSSLEEQTTVTAPPTVTSADSLSAAPGTLDTDNSEPAVNNQATPQPNTPDVTPTPSPTSHNLIQRLFIHINIYLLLFLLLLIIAAATGTIYYLKANNQAASNNSSSQNLTQSELSQLANSDVTVGGPQYTLNVQSNAVFSGSVLVHSNLQVAGTLQIGSASANTSLTVAGTSTFDNVQINKSLAVSGNGSIVGQFNVQGNLGVNGSATFSGAISAPQLTVSSLQLSGDLTLLHHINAGGSTPTRSYGTALGDGGSASVNGSDTAGSVTINTGTSPVVGCFLTITFATPFSATPHIVITPVGSSAAGLQYYINRSTTNFSICSASVPPASVSFGFDYIAFD